MALDHYVPQVHLKQFLSPALANKQLYGIRKRDLHFFPCGTRDICRIEDGNSNRFLVEPRLIEEFLRAVEPKYDQALADLREDRVSLETIFVISGFAAAVVACAPASMRIGCPSIGSVAEATAKLLDQKGKIPKAPDVLGGKSLTELLDEGTIKLTVDEKFPQTLGIAGVLHRVSGFGNASWAVVHNPHHDSPFFTSDFPIAVHQFGDTFSRLIPLAPDLALGVVADARYRKIIDLSFPGNRRVVTTASRNLVRTLNQQIVRSAEKAVFFRDNLRWIPGFVAKHARYRVEFVPTQLKTPTGFVTIGETRVVPWQDSA